MRQRVHDRWRTPCGALSLICESMQRCFLQHTFSTSATDWLSVNNNDDAKVPHAHDASRIHDQYGAPTLFDATFACIARSLMFAVVKFFERCLPLINAVR